jgi:hydroxyacylglutathione hydrolase
MENPVARPLPPAEVKELVEAGHVIVDARSSADFGAGHIPDSYNVQMSSSEFEQRVGWMTPDNAPLILVTNNAADAQRCIFNMAFIGLDSQVSGYLDGGINDWMSAGHPLETVPQMDVGSLREELTLNGLLVLDVREQEEWDEGHIEGAHFMRYTALVPQLDVPAQLDQLAFKKEQPVAVICGSGQRSGTATSLLRRHGYRNLFNVTGGMEAWKAARMPLVDAQGQACPT